MAWAQDGVIEAVEGMGQDGHLVLGVQWHAETLTEEAEQLALFERLVRQRAAQSSGAQAELTAQSSSEQEEEDSGAHAI